MGRTYSGIGYFPPSKWTYFLFSIGTLFAFRGLFPRLFLVRLKTGKIRPKDSWSQWSIVSIAVLALMLVVWQVNSQTPQTVVLRCRQERIPVANFLNVSGTVLVDPSFPLGSVNRWLVNSARGYPPRYGPQSIGKMIYKCELTNVSRLLLPDVFLQSVVSTIASHGAKRRLNSM